MAVRLDRPLSVQPNDDEQEMLTMLQGNILRSHGRRNTALIVLRFIEEKKASVRRFLKELSPLLTSQERQEFYAKKHKEAKASGQDIQSPPFLSCFLSRTGYCAAGIDDSRVPTIERTLDVFESGMKDRRIKLNDSNPCEWDQAYQYQVHAMILVGGEPDTDDRTSSTQVDEVIEQLESMIPHDAIEVSTIERGCTYTNTSGQAVEHFGFADGLSQPLLREIDIRNAKEPVGQAGPWNPAFPLQQVLVKDPGVPHENAYGSYLVFRKLEQNVRSYNTAVSDLAQHLQTLANQPGPLPSRDLVEAMLMGRFKNGTVVVAHDRPGCPLALSNTYDFSGDPHGLKCPKHAHIRKANPRGDMVADSDITLEDQRSAVIARRAITYGVRQERQGGSFLDQPEECVGLLFMAYQSNILKQFERIQGGWMNNGNFPTKRIGSDPIVGDHSAWQFHRAAWNDETAPKIAVNFGDHIRLKGGEYFFAPSIAFFESL